MANIPNVWQKGSALKTIVSGRKTPLRFWLPGGDNAGRSLLVSDKNNAREFAFNSQRYGNRDQDVRLRNEDAFREPRCARADEHQSHRAILIHNGSRLEGGRQGRQLAVPVNVLQEENFALCRHTLAHRDYVLEIITVPSHRKDVGEGMGRGKHDAGPCQAEHMAQFVGGIRGIARVDCRAQIKDAIEDGRELDAIFRYDANHVALLNSNFPQVGGNCEALLP